VTLRYEEEAVIERHDDCADPRPFKQRTRSWCHGNVLRCQSLCLVAGKQ